MNSLTLRRALLGFAAASASAFPLSAFDFVGSYDLGAVGNGEILSYTADAHTLLSTTSSVGVQVYDFTGSALNARTNVSFGSLGSYKDVSSVAADPYGRGFGVASLIPTANGTTAGAIAFFDYRTGSVLGSVEVGYHPDSLVFSADGSKLFITNEGERTSGGDTDAPGSISIVNLNLGALGSSQVQTYTFESAHLAAGVSTGGLRYNDTFAAGNAFRHIEPEYTTQVGNRLFVTLQENNGLAQFDLGTNQWVSVENLGLRTITIDASDRDGAGGTASAQVNDSVKALPMPDTIASFVAGGTNYVVTANEGDYRGDDGDRTRVKDLGAKLDTSAMVAQYGASWKSDAALGRLRVSNLDGDTNGDGKIDQLVVAGSRGFSVYNADTGALVHDSGSLEEMLLAIDPAHFNLNAENAGAANAGAIDARSPDKGPEPEALRVFTGDDGHTYLALGMERQYGILLYDLADPSAPQQVGYLNTFGLDPANGLAGIESIIHIGASESADGREYLVAGFEYSGDLAVIAIPEPATYAALLGAGALGLALWRRRRG